MSQRVLSGYGDPVKVGDYVRITSHDDGYYGTKGPVSTVDKETYRITKIQFRGNPLLICETKVRGEGMRRHYYGSHWKVEFKLATKRQIEAFKKARAISSAG
jgi:small-conductance mechanosensitive channel